MGNCCLTAFHVMSPSYTRSKQLPVGVPDYARFQTPTIATAKGGRAPSVLHPPCGIAIHEDTHQIFVANYTYKKVEVFSETGEYICQLGLGQLSSPWGIAIHGDSVYVSCWGDHTVSRFSLTEMSLVRRIGGIGSNNGQFDIPSQLTTDPIGRVFIPDTSNHRICVHDPDLNHLRNITHQSMSRPFGVKISRDRMYVLCPYSNPCMHVLTLEGDMLHSLISRKKSIFCHLFFCLDPLNNFVITNFVTHSICVFSPEGNLLHTIGRERHQQGMLYQPTGVAITPNGRLVCVSNDRKHDLQIYF